MTITLERPATPAGPTDDEPEYWWLVVELWAGPIVVPWRPHPIHLAAVGDQLHMSGNPRDEVRQVLDLHVATGELMYFDNEADLRAECARRWPYDPDAW